MRFIIPVLSLVWVVTSSQTIEAGPPNVIYILADDAGIGDFGCYGGKIIRTPNVDRMCAEGLKFTQHYSGSTVCAPSRSVLLTGQHTGHTRVRGNGRKAHLFDEDVTIGEIMTQAGYVTGAIGKWGVGEATTAGAPWKQGFDHYFGYLNQSRAHHYYQDYLWKDSEKVLYPNNPTKRTHYSHDLFAADALEFIKKHQKERFFLYLPFTIPHVDLDVPEESKKEYLGQLEPEKPYGTPGGQHYRHEKFPHATFAGMITHMDRDIGRILDLLQELGIDENTLVMFASDNGATSAGGADPKFFDSNGPYRGIKRDLYEGGIITPMIAWWPGTIQPGRVTDHISGFQDILPTFADLVDVETPKNIDGISFLPTLMDRAADQQQHDYLYWEFTEGGSKRALRQGDWKVVQLKVSSKNPAAPELYNLADDLGEINNLAGKHPEKVRELVKLMDSAHTRSELFPLYASEK